ncbi:MAG: LysM peptidoglycan-binding domain-containing protein [Coriobacteriia bacterium]|nr:LysM peptidoglycan-binding domain-containing protein [Coriobacteriia bacterium]MBN2821842.1 LysM peptidoglycan-binding domain-containing protein [Coriobacteriia bacterium]
MHNTLTIEHARRRARPAKPGSTHFTPVEIGILVLFAVTLLAAAVGPSLLHDRSIPQDSITVKVGESDTLWEIAASNPVAGMSTAENVSLIRRMNGVTNGGVVTGQLLIIPSDSHSGTTLAQN